LFFWVRLPKAMLMLAGEDTESTGVLEGRRAAPPPQAAARATGGKNTRLKS